MRTRVLILVLCVGVFFSVHCKSPSSPEPPPPPMATYTGELTITGIHMTTEDTLKISWKFMVTNTNGVGATFQKVERFLYYQGNQVMTLTNTPPQGERINGNQVYEWAALNTFPYTGFRPDKGKVVISVRDDNNYEVSITGDPATILWLN